MRSASTFRPSATTNGGGSSPNPNDRWADTASTPRGPSPPCGSSKPPNVSVFTLDEVAELLEAGKHHHGTGRGLAVRTEAKLAEVDQKIADLNIIRASLVAARDADCDDLAQCAQSDCCPIPFVQIGERPEADHR